MKTIVKINSGEEFEAFIPLKDKLIWFFKIMKIPREKVLWKKTGTREVYYFNRNKSQLIRKK